MPKVKNPLLSLEARGGIGGLVYNTWRGINTVKTNTSPTGQGTPKRLAAQGLMSTISKLWSAISDANRLAWNQYAVDHPVPDWTGSPKRLTGMNWFMSCLTQIRRVAGSDIDVPPAIAAPNAIVGLALSNATGDLKVAFTSPTGSDTFLDVWVAGPLSKGRNAKLEQAKPTILVEATSGAAQALITAAADGRYTAFARIIDSATGLTSTWVSTYLDMA